MQSTTNLQPTAYSLQPTPTTHNSQPTACIMHLDRPGCVHLNLVREVLRTFAHLRGSLLRESTLALTGAKQATQPFGDAVCAVVWLWVAGACLDDTGPSWTSAHARTQRGRAQDVGGHVWILYGYSNAVCSTE